MKRSREAHYSRFFGKLRHPIKSSTDGKKPHIQIYQFGPTEERPYWTLVTGGMSDLRQPGLLRAAEDGTPCRAELIMYVEEPREWMFQALKRLAQFPFEYVTSLYWFDTFDWQAPVNGSRSELTCFFFLPPYAEDPEFGDLELDGERVLPMWVIPITKSEREYAVDLGGEALEEALKDCDMDMVVDETRESFVEIS